jgi:hypothetical protein
MKKIFTLLAAITLCLGTTDAQTTGGPDTYGYIWRNSFDPSGPAYNWIDILPLTGVSEVRYLADDNTKGSFPIGFPFHFYWYDVTQFWVGSNGYLGFTSGQISHPFPTIPSTSLPQDYLAIMTSDLIFDDLNGAECWRWTSADNDTCIVSFINVPFYDVNPPGWVGNNTFQVILSAVDSSITYQYQTQTGSPAILTTFCSIGIENNSGNIGLQQSYNTLPPSNYAIKFYYPSATTYMVTDASTTSNDNPGTGGIFRSRNGAPFTMTTSIKNTGNQNLTPFNVYSRVLDSTGVVKASDTQASMALIPGQTQNMTMTSTFNPTNDGTYRYVTNTLLAGDATPSNDQKIQELVVVDTTAASIRLSFDNGAEAGLGGLNWTGGNGGAAIYFIPPFYPCKVTDVFAFIAANPSFVGYSIQIYDDNGLSGSAGTLLDSTYVPASSVFSPTWNATTLSTPLTINSGGIYVAWVMQGLGLTLGQNQSPPFSYREYEIIDGTWADYRYRETEDLMINIAVSKISTIGVNEESNPDYFGEVYPNPSASVAVIDYNFASPSDKISYTIVDVQGRTVVEKTLEQEFTAGKLIINTAELSAGIYTCRIIANGRSVARKINVVR